MPRGQSNVVPLFRSAFRSWEDEFDPNLGVRPVVFDILAPDLETSILPPDLKMVLHVNPNSMDITYAKQIERIQTKGGFVEQHWGEAARSISFDMVTGGFVRLYSGLSNITGGGYDAGGTRRETIAYDKFLDMLALFYNNGSVYDTNGQIVFQGILKVTFDGGIYFGWFQSFNVTEAAEKPYQFSLTADFTVSHEVLRLRSMAHTEAPRKSFLGALEPQRTTTPVYGPADAKQAQKLLNASPVDLTPDGSPKLGSPGDFPNTGGDTVA